MEKSIIFNTNEEGFIPQPRDYQIYAKEVLEWEVVNLLQDEDVQGHRLLSRADLILIYTLYSKSGMEGFLSEYIRHAKEYIERHGENAIIIKPHHYLKKLIG